MLLQKDNRAWVLFNSALRHAMVNLPVMYSKSLLVNEYPKSGGTWLTKMLSDLMALPFAKNRLPFITNKQIFHGHYLNYVPIKQVILWRDGRDVVISLYYHSLFYNDQHNKLLVDHVRRLMPFDDYINIKKNLSVFLETWDEKLCKPNYNWSDFVDNWHEDNKNIQIKYEELFDKPLDTLGKILDWHDIKKSNENINEIVSKFSIKNIQNKQRAINPESNSDILSFVRKGGYGGWREIFNHEIAHTFNKIHGKALIKLGYENNETWVNNF